MQQPNEPEKKNRWEKETQDEKLQKIEIGNEKVRLNYVFYKLYGYGKIII